MNMLALHLTPEDAAGRLQPLGLSIDKLHKAVRAALGGFQSTTAFHPSFAPGSYAYMEGTAGLRRAVMPDGVWEVDEQDGQPRTFSERYDVAIILASGDEYTGHDGEKQPTVRNPKGSATEKKVAVNVDSLFPLSWVGNLTVNTEDDTAAKLITWIFLIHFDVREGVVRSELSLPQEFKNGKPCGWIERIVLPEIDFGGGGGDLDALLQPAGDDAGPSADIDVAWKQ